MFSPLRRLLLPLAALVVLAAGPAVAQETVPNDGLTSFAPSGPRGPLALADTTSVTVAAQLTAEAEEIPRGLVWRVFKPEPGPDGKLPLVASAQGGTQVFNLEPGSYLVHAAFGRAGATKRINVTRESKRESLVLEAGGLKLDAVAAGGAPIADSKLRFSIYEERADEEGNRALILPDVEPNRVVRLNAGTYHVVSTYGGVNAVVRSDIRVEAGKLTEATVEHRAADVTFKLVREKGGEAIADTHWSIVSDSGDPVAESVGAYASMVLAEGEYIVIAKNRDRIYQKPYTAPGDSPVVEVVTTDAASQPTVDAETTD